MWRRVIAPVLVMSCVTATHPRAQGSSVSCAFLAAEDARLGDAASIEGDVGVNDAGGFLRLGRRTRVGGDATVTADTVRIGNGSQIPVLFANVLLGSGAKESVGSVSGAILPIQEPFCTIPALDCGGSPVRVKRGATGPQLPPGSYGDVELEQGSRLFLAGGAYQFCSLRVGRRAAIDGLGVGQTTIDVKGDVRLENGSTLGPNGTLPTPILHVGGTAVKLGAGVTVQAFISAPEARFQLGRGSTFTGGVCANRIGTGRRIHLECAEETAPTTTTSTSTTPSTTGSIESTTAAREQTARTTTSTRTTTTGAPTTTSTGAESTTTTSTVPTTTTSTVAASTSTSSTTAPTTTTSSTTPEPSTTSTT